MKVCFSANVRGKVQGVYFRASCQEEAIDMALSGYARNLDNGDVEVLMCGEQENIDKMLLWLEQGSPEAEVEQVEHKQVPWQEHPFFAIG